MKQWLVISKTHGTHYILMDDIDFDGMKMLGGKWCITKKRGHFYAQKRFNGKLVEMHRYFMQPMAHEYVDHINGNTLDNRRSNLRVCTNSANIRNGKLRENNKSGFPGVFYITKTKKWIAFIKVKYKRFHLGSFNSFEEAVETRKLANLKYWSN